MSNTPINEYVKELEEDFLCDEKYLQEIIDDTERRKKVSRALHARTQVAIESHQLLKRPAIYKKISGKIEEVVDEITNQDVPSYEESPKAFNSFTFSLGRALDLAERSFGKLAPEAPSQKSGGGDLNLQLAVLVSSAPIPADSSNSVPHTPDPIPVDAEVL